VVGYLTAVKILETSLLAGLKPGRFSIDSIYDSILNPREWKYFIRLRQDTLQIVAGRNGEVTRRSLARRRVGFGEFRFDTP
jgi:hypothetical protein